MSSAGTRDLGRAAEAGELALFHKTLAELCRAEVPLPRALRLLQGDLRRGRFRDVVGEMAVEVEAGAPLGEAYRKRRGTLPRLYTALIEVGMVSGDLPGVLDEISRHAARRADFAARLRRALAYPLTAALFVLVLGGFLTVFVGPALWRYPVEAGGRSPHPYALAALGALGLLAAGAFACGWVRGPLDRTGRRVFRFPVLGRIRLHAARASLCATLALLLRRQVPLGTAVTLAAETCDDDALAHGLAQVTERVGGGASLHSVLEEAKVLEPTLLWLVGAAEGTQDVPRALDDVASVYAARLERAVDRLTTFVTPVAELVVGVVVFVFAYSFLVPLVAQWTELWRL